jgi:NADH:ubiquinone oxidoreductase subunit 2 (subunit N)
MPVIAVIGIISVITMTTGNLSATYQKNVKRMLAYSSIAHAGYMLISLVVLDKEGFTAIVLYLIVREMFLRQPEVQTPIKARFVVMWVIAIMAIPTVLLGIYWEPICSAIDAASSALANP